ncbi:MAG: bifunctional phosphoribosylaminoimidazolecarboxamide formyltransferase/inosine monophosphate cyclohydrolase [Rhodospirillaceae bacterium]|nr:bifunctional phosphoribosylaminoimidazolecarboxamide formyltransferase/inosine monophosphate cyclohydrolase [Rhodospirillaceae bacterium]
MTKNFQVKKIKRALISVYDKTELIPFCEFLSSQGVEILSTGGTSSAIKNAGLKITEVSDYTLSPEILGGRVKTLHPMIHGGILAKRSDSEHIEEMKRQNILPIDLVVVNLYPFKKTIDSQADFNECIENIDIGGPTMIRAAAKNYMDVTIIVQPSDYKFVKDEMLMNNGGVSRYFREKLAVSAFSHTAEYDGIISNWFQSQDTENPPKQLNIVAKLRQKLRYGENPHLSATFYHDGTNRAGVATAKQLQGKELSYNNINDTDSAFELVAEFDTPTVAIVKHANPCGVSSAENIDDAFNKALECDPVSAYGGIIALNRNVDTKISELIKNHFAEVLIAPKIDPQALEILSSKKNLRILITGELPNPKSKNTMLRSVSGGLLIQDRDFGSVLPENLETVTKCKPSDDEIKDLIFAFKVCKHTKSNAIVYAKNESTVGIGAGQMSRVDSSKIAAWKAGHGNSTQNNKAAGSVVASDAFFPFADGLLAAAEAGVTAVIQPGGSMRDKEVIEAANERNISMVFTGLRHFRH